MTPAIDDLPGYRRRFVLTIGPGWVRSAMEDDYHGMALTIRHDGVVATAIEAEMERAPWTTCPGALAVVRQTFMGVPLAAFGTRGAKSANCTHLHDLAVLAAAHAGDAAPLVYDILVADPVAGVSRAELRRDGVALLAWTVEHFRILAPVEMAGITLDRMNPWLNAQAADVREAAKLLRWGTIVASGRAIPLALQSDASVLPAGSCYTFQPDIAPRAIRIGMIRDFSAEGTRPLAAEATLSGNHG